MSETIVIPEISFPKIPDGIDDSLRDYLVELETVLRNTLRGSAYLEEMLDTGILGN